MKTRYIHGIFADAEGIRFQRITNDSQVYVFWSHTYRLTGDRLVRLLRVPTYKTLFIGTFHKKLIGSW